jgi:dTMP kinase
MNEIIGLKRGFLISFEGVDGSGKDCQVDLLRQALQKTGFEVSVFRCPGDTKIGELVRTIVKDPENKNICKAAELYLMNASHAQLVHEKIVPALKEGHIVICNRFIYSTVVYQYYGRQIDPAIVEAVIHFAVGDCFPNLTFMLDLSDEESAKRLAKRGTTDRFEQEDKDFQARVRAGYDWLKSLENQSQGKIIAIDAAGTPETVHTEIWRCVAAKISALNKDQLAVNFEKKIKI